MKNLLFIIFILFLSISSRIEANTDIVFVDMDKILSSSNAGLSFLSQLKIINNNNLKKFKKSEKLIKEKEKKMISQKNILSEEQFNKEINLLKSDIKKYNDDRNKINNDFNKLKLENTNKLLQLINPLLRTYADENSIEMVLQKKNIIMGKTEFDITEKIITIVNNNINEFKIK
jgi:outer membrane protein